MNIKQKIQYLWFCVQSHFRSKLLQQFRKEYQMKQKLNRAENAPITKLYEARIKYHLQRAVVYDGYGMHKEAAQARALAAMWEQGLRREQFMLIALTANTP